MATPVYGQTFWTIKKAIARGAGDLVEAGTASGGSATTLVDATRFTDATDTRLKGVNVYIGNGAGQGRETRGTAFTTGTDTITIPTGTALDNTSEYLLTRRFTQSDILDAIRRALWAQGKYAKDWLDQSLIAGSPLRNATFYDSSGTFPNTWSRTGTGGSFTQVTTVGSPHGRFAAQIVSNGTNEAGIQQAPTGWEAYQGRTVTARAWIYANVASRASISITDGITTRTYTHTTTGWTTSEIATSSLAVAVAASTLRVDCDISAGSAVTAYFAGIYITGLDWNEWNVPAGSPTCITCIKYEKSRNDGFQGTLSRSAYQIVRESTRRLRLNAHVPQGSILEIDGRTSWADHATAASDDDTTFDGDAAGLIAAATAILLESRSDGSDADERKIKNLRALAAEHGFGKAVEMPSGSLPVERQ